MPFDIQRQSVFRCAYIGKYSVDSIAAIPFALKLLSWLVYSFQIPFATHTNTRTHTNKHLQSHTENQWSIPMSDRICTFFCVSLRKYNDDDGFSYDDRNLYTNIFNSFHKYAYECQKKNENGKMKIKIGY